MTRMSPYEQAFNRIRAEFTEMPGMRLTSEQVERLSGISNSVCKLVLDDLVRAGFLSDGNGTYARLSGLDRVTRGVSRAESSASASGTPLSTR